MSEMNGDDQAILPFDDGSAGRLIRRVWHEGRWYFSVVDVIAVLTDSPVPRTYWAVLKKRLQDESFQEALANCCSLKVPATDGKLYKTDCADFATIMALLFSLPAWQRRRRQKRQWSDTQSTCNSGIYAITNILTQERYIGSSNDISARFNQHKALLRQGKHHAKSLQEAWMNFGEDAFRFEILEELPDTQYLEVVEQRYLDAEQPSYNNARIAQNNACLPPVATGRFQSVLRTLFEMTGFGNSSPIFAVIRDAILMGALRPGPNFSLILDAERYGTTASEELSTFLQTSYVAS